MKLQRTLRCAHGPANFKKLYERVKEEIEFYGMGHGYYLTGDVVLKMFISDLIVNGQNKMIPASYALVFLLLLFVTEASVKRLFHCCP